MRWNENVKKFIFRADLFLSDPNQSKSKRLKKEGLVPRVYSPVLFKMNEIVRNILWEFSVYIAGLFQLRSVRYR